MLGTLELREHQVLQVHQVHRVLLELVVHLEHQVHQELEEFQVQEEHLVHQVLEVFLELGMLFSILAMGYYVSYTILDFPDLTVEGTFLTGGVVFGLFVHWGINPWLGLIAAFLVGAGCGAVTGMLHVKLKIRPLLCGILVSTALITVNLIGVTAGTAGDFKAESTSIISFGRDAVTLSDAFFPTLIPARLQALGNIPLRLQDFQRRKC